MRRIRKELDPDGVEERKKSRLKRRVYLAAGPYESLHSDQNDKLLRWGFGLHAGVDGNMQLHMLGLFVCSV